jgi:hypothetical protein
MNKITKVGIIVVALAVAFASGRYLTPEKVTEKLTTKTEIEYITREIKGPDGTITKEVIKRDVVEKVKDKVVEAKKPQYKASVIPKYSFSKNTISYGASIEKRLIGPVFGGVYADSEGTVGAVISLEF